MSLQDIAENKIMIGILESQIKQLHEDLLKVEHNCSKVAIQVAINKSKKSLKEYQRILEHIEK